MTDVILVEQNKAGVIEALEKIIQLKSSGIEVEEVMLRSVDKETIPPEQIEALLNLKVKSLKS
jgi:hypothetical protein